MYSHKCNKENDIQEINRQTSATLNLVQSIHTTLKGDQYGRPGLVADVQKNTEDIKKLNKKTSKYINQAIGVIAAIYFIIDVVLKFI